MTTYLDEEMPAADDDHDDEDGWMAPASWFLILAPEGWIPIVLARSLEGWWFLLVVVVVVVPLARGR